MSMENKIKQLQLTELEILIEVDKFCRKHKINYSLYCGTMLGAVRHKGFIPWDDDIDICMLREDYKHFINLWEKTNNSEFIIQNKENTSEFQNSFTKIRKNNTTFLQENEKNANFQTGIFIDILPLDRYPSRKIQRFLYKWNLMKYLLYTRGFIPQQSNIVTKLVSKFMLKINNVDGKSINKARDAALKKITKYNGNKKLSLVSSNSLDGLRHLMSCDLPNEYVEIDFEGRKFMCYKDFDNLLSSWYGNYMELPPENERIWRHMPILLDFEKNYSEIKESK